MKSSVNAISRALSQRSFGLLLMRLGLGLLFLLHGWTKLSGMSTTVHMFGSMGFPAYVAYFIAWLEFLGGIALILGIATRLFAVLFGVEMLVAALLVGFGRIVSVEMTLMLIFFGLAFTGSGRYSVFGMECQKCGGMLCNGKMGVCTKE